MERKKINRLIRYFNYKTDNKYKDLVDEKLNNAKVIIKKRFIILSLKNYLITGYYEPKNNQIIVYDDKDKQNVKNTFFHELFHLLSGDGLTHNSRRNKNYYGTSINEGFTSYLTNKYFDDNDNYTAERKFIEILNYIIGEEKMEELYFSGDIYGLIEELKNLKFFQEKKVNDPRKPVINLIRAADHVFYYYRNMFTDRDLKNIKDKHLLVRSKKFDTKEYVLFLEYILRFLTDSLIEKLINDIVNFKITPEEAFDFYKKNMGDLYKDLLYRKNKQGELYIKDEIYDFDSKLLNFDDRLMNFVFDYITTTATKRINEQKLILNKKSGI